MKKHKHSELIKLWADGAEIEYYSSIINKWLDTHNSPVWDEDTQYRLKLEPWQQKLVDAIESGKVVDFNSYDWYRADVLHERVENDEIHCYHWYAEDRYRIRPKAKPEWQQKLIDAVKAGKTVEWNAGGDTWVASNINDSPDPTEFTFDNDMYRYRIDYRTRPKSVSRWQWILLDKITKSYRVDSNLFTDEEAHARFDNSPYFTLMGKVDHSETIFNDA